jgi:hypothetical protein
VFALVVVATVSTASCDSKNSSANNTKNTNSVSPFCSNAIAFSAKYARGVNTPDQIPGLVDDLKALVRQAPPDVVGDLRVIEDAVEKYSTGQVKPPADESTKVQTASNNLAKYSQAHCATTATTAAR